MWCSVFFAVNITLWEISAPRFEDITATEYSDILTNHDCQYGSGIWCFRDTVCMSLLWHECAFWDKFLGVCVYVEELHTKQGPGFVWNSCFAFVSTLDINWLYICIFCRLEICCDADKYIPVEICSRHCWAMQNLFFVYTWPKWKCQDVPFWYLCSFVHLNMTVLFHFY